MKLFIVLAIGATGYYFFLTTTSNVVLGQFEQIKYQYQSAEVIADRIAAGEAVNQH